MIRRFLTDRGGNVALIVALMLPVIVGIGIGALNIDTAMGQRRKAQDALDAAALAAVAMLGSNADDTAVTTKTRALLAAADPSDTALPLSQIAIDRSATTVEINYTSAATNTTKTPIWDAVFNVKARTKAAMGGGARYPVCILITEPTDNHTLRASDGSKVDLNNCLVQVNTQNWDAVEAKDNAYIHINNGQNCYVGDIHFGDITPAKMPTCNLFPDPHASVGVTIPTNCDHTDFVIDNKHPHSAPLDPGVYCGGIELEQDATFNPGVYYLKDGPLKVNGQQADVHALGVTFVLCGDDAGIEIKQGGKLEFSPASAAVAGKYDGYVFYLDQSAASDPSSTSEFTKAVVDITGVIYLNGQHVIIGKSAKVTMNGSMVAGYLLPQGGDLVFNGLVPTASAAAAKSQKTLGSTVPVIVS